MKGKLNNLIARYEADCEKMKKELELATIGEFINTSAQLTLLEKVVSDLKKLRG